jgi:NAD(P)-dependent dehydrogenase (short-subunit alcohol dehydrogenase family)
MVEKNNSLKTKLAIVTGASTGIGFETAKIFAERGATVVMIARREEELKKAATQVGNNAVSKIGDVASKEDIDRIVAEVTEEHGVADYLITAAGICVPGLLKELSIEEFNDHLNVNVTGSFYIAQKVGLSMARNGGGSIVFVGSEQSHMGMGYYTAYCTSKTAILGLTRCFAAELAPENVRVNAICPGPVDTPMLESEIVWFGGGEDIRREAYERVPLKRLAQPAELAESIFFLANAQFATGSAMNIDGGTTMI